MEETLVVMIHKKKDRKHYMQYDPKWVLKSIFIYRKRGKIHQNVSNNYLWLFKNIFLLVLQWPCVIFAFRRKMIFLKRNSLPTLFASFECLTRTRPLLSGVIIKTITRFWHFLPIPYAFSRIRNAAEVSAIW